MDERGNLFYARTQPFGHEARIGIEPKSSWRRWRALKETQPNGQSLVEGGAGGGTGGGTGGGEGLGDGAGMDAPLRKSQASWVVSNGAPPRSSLRADGGNC